MDNEFYITLYVHKRKWTEYFKSLAYDGFRNFMIFHNVLFRNKQNSFSFWNSFLDDLFTYLVIDAKKNKQNKDSIKPIVTICIRKKI